MRTVLALNAGSATLKFALFEADGLKLLARGLVDRWGASDQRLKITGAAGEALFDDEAPGEREASARFLFDWIARQWPQARLAAIGHRIVHGGAAFDGPVQATPDVVAELEALSPLAPLHQPWGLMGLKLAREAMPDAVQVASFDTAFHRTMAPVATRLALPREYEARGVRRYGFHGLSYAWIAGRLSALDPQLAKGRVIVAHLGAGASLCAMRGGRSVDTTRGFSALDGLIMATRCGTIDPGVLLHLLAHGMSGPDQAVLHFQRSGLLGVWWISGDMRALLASVAPAAREALELYVRSIVIQNGALIAPFGGLDCFVFTGGLGENAAPVRAAVVEGLGWLGLRLDRDAAAGGGERKVSPPRAPPVWIIPTNEEAAIAAEAVAVA